jgi:hypothetical protein
MGEGAGQAPAARGTTSRYHHECLMMSSRVYLSNMTFTPAPKPKPPPLHCTIQHTTTPQHHCTTALQHHSTTAHHSTEPMRRTDVLEEHPPSSKATLILQEYGQSSAESVLVSPHPCKVLREGAERNNLTYAEMEYFMQVPIYKHNLLRTGQGDGTNNDIPAATRTPFGSSNSKIGLRQHFRLVRVSSSSMSR